MKNTLNHEHIKQTIVCFVKLWKILQTMNTLNKHLFVSLSFENYSKPWTPQTNNCLFLKVFQTYSKLWTCEINNRLSIEALKNAPNHDIKQIIVSFTKFLDMLPIMNTWNKHLFVWWSFAKYSKQQTLQTNKLLFVSWRFWKILQILTMSNKLLFVWWHFWNILSTNTSNKSFIV